jgi:multidrug efflux pump subunit AcrA (membrane-fusion protein)
MSDQDQELATTDNSGTVEEQATKGHPAWDEILSKIPEEFHPLVTPTLEKWDSGVQNKIQDLHSQFDPYREVIGDVDLEVVDMALKLAEAVQADPEAVYRQLAEAYGFDSGEQGVTEMENTAMSDLFTDDSELAAQLAEQRQMLEALQQERQAEIEAAQQAQEDMELSQLLDEYLGALHEEYGDFNDDFVVTLMGNGMDGEEAVQEFFSIVKEASSNSQGSNTEPAPAVLGSGGNIPSNAIDPSKLNPSQTSELVAQLLAMDNDT